LFQEIEKDANRELETNEIDNQYEEKTSNGNFSWKTCFAYYKIGAGGNVGAVCVIFLFILTQSLIVFADFWASHWFVKFFYSFLFKPISN
jgi:hypothetical protein